MLIIKNSSKFLFDRFMDSFVPEMETCPICHCKGDCHIHAYYNRSITDYADGHKIKHSICVMRVMCDSCQHTHAILPDHIIPYGTHGLFFVLRVLAEHLCLHRTIAGICDKYDISEKLFYKWKSLFKLHKKLWLGELKDLETSLPAFIRKLLIEPFSEFSRDFISCFSFSFLQAHKNPQVTFKNTAGYCQKVFTPDYKIT